MYPYIRLLFHQTRAKRQPILANPFAENIQYMRVWPWDIDMFMELNNGRYLTIMDIGRFGVGYRTGLFDVLKQEKWGLMVGAVSSRYRRRLRLFDRFSLHTKLIYFDHRWFYFHQWFVGKNGKVHASFLVRTAVVSRDGLVPCSSVVDAMNYDGDLLKAHNQSSEWIDAWLASDTIHKEIMERM